jgi:hypothetical protein
VSLSELHYSFQNVWPNQALERTAQSRFSVEFRVSPRALAVARPGFPGLSLSLIRSA